MTKEFIFANVVLISAFFILGCEQAKNSFEVSPHTLHFAPSENLKFIEVSNTGTTRLAFAAVPNKNWLQITPTEFILGPEDTISVQVYLNRDYSLIEKAFPSFSTGIVHIESFIGDQPVTITTAPNYFTEIFEGNIDLANHTLSFVPDKSINYYKLTISPVSQFPNPTHESTLIDFSSNKGLFKWVLPENKKILFYDKSYNTLFISAQGWVGLGEPKKFPISPSDYKKELMYYFYTSHISTFPTNALAGGKVSYLLLQNKAVITYEGIPTAGKEQNGSTNSFQIELFFSGKINIHYLNLDSSASGIIGFSYGAGQITIPSGFVESDLIP